MFEKQIITHPNLEASTDTWKQYLSIKESKAKPKKINLHQ